MKVTPAHLEIIRSKSVAYLATDNWTLADVKNERNAWTVLHKSGAYRAIGDEHPSGYPDYNDSHLRTALKAVFPAAF